MKKIVYILLAGILLQSCKKGGIDNRDGNAPITACPGIIQEELQQQMKPADFLRIDWSRCARSRYGSQQYYRLGFTGLSVAADFILLQTGSAGHIQKGKIIHLEKAHGAGSMFNGSIVFRNLDGSDRVTSAIVNGYVQMLPSHWATVGNSASAQRSPEQVLPEVIVVAKLVPREETAVLYNTYYSLEFLLGTGNNSGSQQYYSPADCFTPIDGGDAVNVVNNNDILVYFDAGNPIKGINLNWYMGCFGTLPDAGAQYAVYIFADLPVDDNPAATFNWYTGATGHVFMQLSKTVNGQSVSQVIGFTAQNALDALANDATPGKYVDNGEHKYNAFLKMDVNESAFKTVVEQVRTMSAVTSYSLLNYNCMDFALAAINSIRPYNPIVVPKYSLPGPNNLFTSTPQGLYNVLESMAAAGGPEADNIITGVVLHAGKSNGPCK